MPLRAFAPSIKADLVHYDMHYYQAFLSAMQWIADFAHVTLIVDDFYQPTLVGIVDAVNESRRLLPGREQRSHAVHVAHAASSACQRNRVTV